MDYLVFDLLALALPAGWLLRGVAVSRVAFTRGRSLPVAGLAVLAVLWTAPWDEHLVRTAVWSYPPDRVLARIGAVPVEEYLFVILEVVLVAAWGLRWAGPAPAGPVLPPHRPLRRTGALGWVFVAAAGAVLLIVGGHLRYAGLLLIWAAPPLALQHAVAGDVLWSERSRRLRTALPVALWLCVADRLALAHGIWAIAPASASGATLWGLPVEEALFFVLTSLLVSDGLLLGGDPFVLARVRALLPPLRHPGLHARTAARVAAAPAARGGAVVAVQPLVGPGRSIGQHHRQSR